MIRFTPNHEWVRVQGKVGVVGITQIAKKEFGTIVHVELPVIGSSVQAGDAVCVLESTKSATDVDSPVSGKIIEVNELLKTLLDPINGSSEQNGWLFRIELSHPEELDQLLSSSEYESLCQPPPSAL